MSDPEEIAIPVADCETKAVTVFSDRAEVTRIIKFTPTVQTAATESEGGDKQEAEAEAADDEDGAQPYYTLVIRGLTAHADSDSIRVKLVGDSGVSSGLIRVRFHCHRVCCELTFQYWYAKCNIAWMEPLCKTFTTAATTPTATTTSKGTQDASTARSTQDNRQKRANLVSSSLLTFFVCLFV